MEAILTGIILDIAFNSEYSYTFPDELAGSLEVFAVQSHAQ